MAYFTNFNKVLYNLEDNTYSSQLVTNILQRSAFLKEISENTAIAYEYYVKDSDTPEIIAHKLYGSAERHWIVLLYNKIINPYYDFPMSQNKLDKFIENKYGYNIYTAQTTLHHYEKKVTKNHYAFNALQYTTVERYEVAEYKVDPNTGNLSSWASLPTVGVSVPLVDEDFDETFSDGTRTIGTVTLEFASVYEYEYELNESRKTIKLLDSRYVPQVEVEFRNIMRDV